MAVVLGGCDAAFDIHAIPPVDAVAASDARPLDGLPPISDRCVPTFPRGVVAHPAERGSHRDRRRIVD